MTIRRRLRLGRVSSMRRAAERKNQSICLVVIFLAFFACIVVTEVFLVDKQDITGEVPLWNRFYREELPTEKYPDEVTPRVARELNRVPQEGGASEDYLAATAKKKYPKEYNGTAFHDDRWQSVKGTKDKFFVFSAYYDDRKTRTIRVVAAARTRIAERVVCVFWFGPGEETATVYATNKLIRENWNLKYSAYFLLCPLRRDIPMIPKEVSIVKPGSGEPANRLVIHNNRLKYKEPKGLAVCVKPMHYSYNKMLDFVEFVELNRLMGASHFILYNHTVGPNVSCALDHYKQRGLVSVLPWQLDMASQKEIRTEGLFAALNDCLYRTMYRFRYVLMIDFDEFVVPHSNTSLTSMLNYLTSRNPARIGAYSFQNAFFYLQWPNDTRARDLQLPLLTLLKTKRKSRLHAHKQRSKCIVLPERVVEMGNHFVWEFMPGKIMQNVHPDTAFLHHYRVCEFGGSDCINTTSTVDRRVYTWKDNLIKSVSSILATMQGLFCGKKINQDGASGGGTSGNGSSSNGGEAKENPDPT